MGIDSKTKFDVDAFVKECLSIELNSEDGETNEGWASPMEAIIAITDYSEKNPVTFDMF